jgi:hypothetical protein
MACIGTVGQWVDQKVVSLCCFCIDFLQNTEHTPRQTCRHTLLSDLFSVSAPNYAVLLYCITVLWNPDTLVHWRCVWLRNGVIHRLRPVRLCWNLAYADTYVEMLWEKNIVLWLKSNSSELGAFYTSFSLLMEWNDLIYHHPISYKIIISIYTRNKLILPKLMKWTRNASSRKRTTN